MITKGKILREDFALFDGINTRETRRDSTGGTIQGNRIGGQVDVLVVYGPDRHRSSIVRAITAIDENNATLQFTPGIWEIDDNLTIPSNFESYIHAGAIFNVSASKTLTFSGPIIRESDTWSSGTVSYDPSNNVLVHQSDLASTDPGKGQGLVYYPITDIETDAGVDIISPQAAPFNIYRYLTDPTASDIATEFQDAATNVPFLEFPRNTYRISSTITRQSFSRWVGRIPQSSYNGSGDVTPEVVIYGAVANIGTGNPLIRLSPVNTATQSHVTENMGFQGDLSVNTSDLSTISTTGVVGIMLDHAKNGVDFVQTSFSNLQHGVDNIDTDPYLDKITFNRCHFSRLYRAIRAHPTAGIHLTDCQIYDCFDFIDSNTDVALIECSLNNSNFASENTSVTARKITVVGGWCEGGNNVFQPSEFLSINGFYASETYSASGSTKFLIKPQGDNVTIVLIGVRIPTNTRLINFDNVSDLSTITVVCIGCSNGTNFGNTADIDTYIGSINYYGIGNTNSPSWNNRSGRNAQNADYTLKISDNGKLLYHSSASTHTWTIPANASVVFPIGSEINLANENGGGNVTLAITSDTLRYGSSTGSRTLAANGTAKLLKVAGTTWRLTGDGIT